MSSTGNAVHGNILSSGLISATANITGNYFLGNGSQLIGIAASNIIGAYGNANVANYLPTFSGNLTAGNISASGNTISGNILTDGLMSSTGNITGGNILTSGLISASSNITGGNLITSGDIILTGGNITGANVVTANIFSATGNIITSNTFVGNVVATTVSTTGNVQSGNVNSIGIITATGNITGGNILTAGLISVTGNLTVGNLTVVGNLFDSTGMLNITTAGNGNIGLAPNGTGIVTVSTSLSAIGNITGNYLIGDGSQITNIPANSITGSYSNANVANYLPTFSGNLTAGNISASGTINATGIIRGASLVGLLSNGTSRINITSAAGNITFGVGGFGTTVMTVAPLLVSVTGNITANNITFASLAATGGTPLTATDTTIAYKIPIVINGTTYYISLTAAQ